MLRSVLLAICGIWFIPTNALPSEATNALDVRKTKHNDFSCKSSSHPNPVVLLHGLGATYYEDLNYLQAYLSQQGFCTFSLTYGAYPGFPYAGGLQPINESAAQIATFIKQVKTKTGAQKIDIVGHSEGGFQTLYVPKFEGISSIAETLVAIAPPTHGTTVGGLENLSIGGLSKSQVKKILETVGCAACPELLKGSATVKQLNNGPVVQPGNRLTVIASETDEVVTPVWTAFVNETGVTNEYVQKYCPSDRTGHIGEAYDTNVWNLVVNALDNTPDRTFTCSAGGPPFRE